MEKRVINIPKEDFDNIKAYCDKENLNMPKWITASIVDKIRTNISFYLPKTYDDVKIKSNFWPTNFGFLPVIIHSTKKLDFGQELLLRNYEILKTWIKDHKNYSDTELRTQLDFLLNSMIELDVVGISIELNNDLVVSKYINDEQLYFTVKGKE